MIMLVVDILKVAELLTKIKNNYNNIIMILLIVITIIKRIT